jgi:predicted PurR-regulated permease PerM|tara:strand:+ start:1084 stop:1350 length:267 start_codon:yes stop_codon:yes gene_type:complete
MILKITLGIFVILTIALSYAVYNLLLKQEQLEDWVENYIDRINEVNTKIRQIDYKGYFEVDDEVGQVFEQIKNEVKSLEELTEITEEN